MDGPLTQLLIKRSWAGSQSFEIPLLSLSNIAGTGRTSDGQGNLCRTGSSMGYPWLQRLICALDPFLWYLSTFGAGFYIVGRENTSSVERGFTFHSRSHARHASWNFPNLLFTVFTFGAAQSDSLSIWNPFLLSVRSFWFLLRCSMLVLIYEINFLFMTFHYICAQFPLTSHNSLVEIKTFPCVLNRVTTKMLSYYYSIEYLGRILVSVLFWMDWNIPFTKQIVQL